MRCFCKAIHISTVGIILFGIGMTAVGGFIKSTELIGLGLFVNLISSCTLGFILVDYCRNICEKNEIPVAPQVDLSDLSRDAINSPNPIMVVVGIPIQSVENFQREPQ